MPVEVVSELHGLGVYLAGERLSCSITFTNQSSTEETIAWASAQIHCQACYREDVVKVDPDKLPPQSPGTDTTFVPNRGERGHTLLSTPTSVLFCNLTLNPGETKSVFYSEIIPCGGPPTFGGRLAKYSYKLAVGAQKPGCPAQIIRTPFRVMFIPESLYSGYIVPSPKDTNPFLSSEVKESPILEVALEALAAETSRRTLLNYTLKNPHGVLGRVSLFKPAYKLGEDITGTLDLSQATIACLQITVLLQCVEEVSELCVQSSAPLSSVCTTHTRHMECCHNTLQSQFALPVPLTATQTFPNGTVNVKWQLHFEFLISRSPPSELMKATPTVSLSGSKAVLWKGGSPVSMDTMTWDLPVTILPALSDQVEPLSQAKHRLTL